MAAALRDVVEDTSVTFQELAAEGFPDEVIAAVRALTKTKGEARLVAAKRTAEHFIARNVKLADVLDNMNLGRISEPTEKDLARLQEYERVRVLLIEHGATLHFHQTCGRD
jgi:GTP diphosphokinase / guanosine-3',5'-bis(diphosphate) 3'-diphosphatase